jgi:acetyl-CoA carboxylase / biotin carboxylase 1
VQYLKYLEKGQPAPPSLSLTRFTVDLMLDSDKFTISVARVAPDRFELTLDDSAVEVAARRLSDGSILCQVDGGSHVIHAEEEASGTRLTIDNLTCLLPNERDPSCLRAHSPGKLIRCACSACLAFAVPMLVPVQLTDKL